MCLDAGKKKAPYTYIVIVLKRPETKQQLELQRTAFRMETNIESA